MPLVPQTISLADLDRILDINGQLVGRVRLDQWAAPTPCAEWDVRQLVGHMTTGNRMFAAIAREEMGDGPEAMQRLRQRVAPGPGDEPVESFRASARELSEAFSRPGFLEGRYLTPLGEQVGAFLVRMRTTENLVHGWDLARATGQHAGFPEAAVEQALEMVRESLAGRPRPMFGTEQPAPADAPPLDRLAAFLGRTV
jgi:uncharacterized protein (TIGR03086 family)